MFCSEPLVLSFGSCSHLCVLAIICSVHRSNSRSYFFVHLRNLLWRDISVPRPPVPDGGHPRASQFVAQHSERGNHRLSGRRQRPLRRSLRVGRHDPVPVRNLSTSRRLWCLRDHLGIAGRGTGGQTFLKHIFLFKRCNGRLTISKALPTHFENHSQSMQKKNDEIQILRKRDGRQKRHPISQFLTATTTKTKRNSFFTL